MRELAPLFAPARGGVIVPDAFGPIADPESADAALLAPASEADSERSVIAFAASDADDEDEDAEEERLDRGRAAAVGDLGWRKSRGAVRAEGRVSALSDCLREVLRRTCS